MVNMLNNNYFKALNNIKLYILLASILFTMTIKTGLILPLLLQHPSYIASVLMLLALIVMFASGRRFHIENTLTVFFLVAIFIIFTIYGLLVISGISFSVSSIPTYLQPLVLTSLFIALLLLTKQNEFRLLLRYYIIFCVIMAISGIIASILINHGIVEFDVHYWSLYDHTDGRATRDKGTYGYAFPYGLGLVLTGEYNVFQLIIFRSSGWLHEPTSATLFIAPALILLAKEKMFSKRVTRYFFISLIIFWMACAAVGSMLAFMILILLYMFVAKGERIILRRVFVGMFFMAAGYLYFEPTLYYMVAAPAGGYESLFLQKFNMNGGVRIIIELFSPDTIHDYIYLSLYLLIASVTTYFAFSILHNNDDKSLSFILILLYFAIHAFKGGYGHVYSSFFVLAFIFMSLRVYISSWNITSQYSIKNKVNADGF